MRLRELRSTTHRETDRFRLLREYAPVGLAVAFGLVLSTTLQRMMHLQVNDVSRYDFSEESKTCIRVFERGLQSNIDMVRWLGATFSASPELTRGQFADLVESLESGSGGAMELQWLPRVAAADRATFEENAQRGGSPSFAIHEIGPDGRVAAAGERPDYLPLLYTQNEGARAANLGFDLQSDPVMRRYVNLAVDKGQMFFVSDAPWLRGLAGRGAVLALCPVYTKHGTNASTDDRRATLLGFAAGLIRLDALSNAALDTLSELEIDVHIFDYFGEPGHQLLHYRPGRSQTRTEPYVLEGDVQLLDHLSYVGALSLGETRRWLIACTPAPDYAFGIQSWSPWLGLALGLAFTFVIGYHFHANVRQRRAAEALVLRRTAELKRTNERLVHEVAERKRFELERDDLLALLEASNASLQQLNTRLERSNQDLQDFAMVSSHDLKEPLRKVRVLAQSLRDRLGGRLESGASEYLDLMEAALQRMHNLITDLLRISRVTTHGQPFERVDLGRIVSEAISDLAVRVEETGGEIEVGQFPTIEADPMQMRQFVQNILDNSLKYHREGVPPRIRVRAAEPVGAPPENGEGAAHAKTCTIVFEDNGIGFAPESTERAFTLFQRLENGARVEGSGVGLAVCRKIAERHGGTIAVRSEVGQGSTFTITLPVTQNGS